MASAYKTAVELSKKVPVVVVTGGKPSRDRVNKHLTVYRLWDLTIPDPVNYNIVPTLFLRLPQIIRREKPNVFLINKFMFFTSLAVFQLKLMGKKVFLQTDAYPGINWFPRSTLVKVVMWIYARLIGIPILKLADKVILLHAGLIPIAKRLGLRYTVVHNGVDVQSIRTAKLPRDLVKKQDELWVGYVGRLETVKGYEMLLGTARELTAKYPKLKFLFVGDLRGKGHLREEYASPQIIFTGHRDDVASLLKLMDIFVLASYSEGLPNALMEAMAAGVACVSTNVGGVPVLIEHEKTGLLVPPGDQGEFRRAIERLVEDAGLRKKLGVAGSQKVEAEFDWSKISDQLLNLLTKG